MSRNKIIKNQLLMISANISCYLYNKGPHNLDEIVKIYNEIAEKNDDFGFVNVEHEEMEALLNVLVVTNNMTKDEKGYYDYVE